MSFYAIAPDSIFYYPIDTTDYLDFFGIREVTPESLDDDSVLEYLKKQK